MVSGRRLSSSHWDLVCFHSAVLACCATPNRGLYVFADNIWQHKKVDQRHAIQVMQRSTTAIIERLATQRVKAP